MSSLRDSQRRVVLAVTTILLFAACAGAERPRALQPPREFPVVIVGAGLTGLTAAYELKKRGLDALVLEQSPRLGGRVQTVEWSSGTQAEAHMEEYWEGSPAIPLLEELGLIDRERDGEAAHSSVRIDGRIYPYRGEGDRDDYLAGVFDASEREAFLRFNDRALTVTRELGETFFAGQPLTDELRALTRLSLRDWVEHQGLPRKVSEWIRVTVEPEMAVEWDLVSALDGIDELRIFLDTPERFGERNYHVPGGNRRFVEALAARLAPEQLGTSARVTAISQDDGGVTVRLLRDEARFESIRTHFVIVTAPLFSVNRIQFSPSLPEQMQQAIAGARFGAYVKLFVGVGPEGLQRTELEGTPTLVLLSDSAAGSIYHASDGDPLKPGADEVLTLLVHGEQARRYIAMSSNEVRERSVAALDEVFPAIAKHVTFVEVFAYPNAVAYWPVAEGRSRFDALSDALRVPFGRIVIGGDTTENSHSEGAIRAALRMARQAVESLERRASVTGREQPVGR